MRALILMALILSPFVAQAARPDHRPTLLQAMVDELGRSMERLKMVDHESPYFVSYRLIDREDVVVEGRFGALIEDAADRARHIAVDVRVGDYRFDSNPDPEDQMLFEMPVAGFRPSKRAPIDNDPASLRATLWLLTDRGYKSALSTYLQKKAKKVTRVEDTHVDSFSKESAVKHIDPIRPLQIDRGAWRAQVRTLSARFKEQKNILDGEVRFSADRQRVYVVNSEGTRVIHENLIYSVSFNIISQAPDGMLLEQGKSLYSGHLNGLPDAKALDALITEALANLDALAKAPIAEPYTGPAILEPEATGVFFHETIGHRLEGERQNDENEGQTFKDRLGKLILPDFLSIKDDPLQATSGDVQLNGHYQHDDQGIAAQTVELVVGGVLKTFLTSRTPVEGVNQSNGHGRAQGVHQPMARMGNLIVSSKKTVSRAKLKQMLLAEVRKQGKPYGLIIADITGGSTNTSTYGYQAFKGAPRMVYRVDAQTGVETLVRGVEMVGTPLTVVSKIMAASDEVGIFNGYCGAESGYVPVSAVAPATLFREIELQRSQRDKERAPLLQPPWRGKD